MIKNPDAIYLKIIGVTLMLSVAPLSYGGNSNALAWDSVNSIQVKGVNQSIDLSERDFLFLVEQLQKKLLNSQSEHFEGHSNSIVFGYRFICNVFPNIKTPPIAFKTFCDTIPFKISLGLYDNKSLISTPNQVINYQLLITDTNPSRAGPSLV